MSDGQDGRVEGRWQSPRFNIRGSKTTLEGRNPWMTAQGRPPRGRGLMSDRLGSVAEDLVLRPPMGIVRELEPLSSCKGIGIEGSLREGGAPWSMAHG